MVSFQGASASVEISIEIRAERWRSAIDLTQIYTQIYPGTGDSPYPHGVAPVEDYRVIGKTVLICQHKACRKAGSPQVLAALQAYSIPDVEIKPVQCLGQCGHGPMILVLPEQIWYDRVQPEEVMAIVERHLQRGKPIKAMLYRKFHPQ